MFYIWEELNSAEISYSFKCLNSILTHNKCDLYENKNSLIECVNPDVFYSWNNINVWLPHEI